MSIVICEICDLVIDIDFVEATSNEDGTEWVCEECENEIDC